MCFGNFCVLPERVSTLNTLAGSRRDESSRISVQRNLQPCVNQLNTLCWARVSRLVTFTRPPCLLKGVDENNLVHTLYNLCITTRCRQPFRKFHCSTFNLQLFALWLRYEKPQCPQSETGGPCRNPILDQGLGILAHVNWASPWTLSGSSWHILHVVETSQRLNIATPWLT